MAKSNKRISGHIAGSKGNLLTERLKFRDLEKTMIVPIEIGKTHHKALIADYFGSILESPFESY